MIHPPTSLGMNSVSRAIGSNSRISSGPALARPLSGGVSRIRQLLEALPAFGNGQVVIGVKVMLSVPGMVHHDLNVHCVSSSGAVGLQHTGAGQTRLRRCVGRTSADVRLRQDAICNSAPT
jgi:hypothetical protein